jgi:hypothetical protein
VKGNGLDHLIEEGKIIRFTNPAEWDDQIEWFRKELLDRNLDVESDYDDAIQDQKP